MTAFRETLKEPRFSISEALRLNETPGELKSQLTPLHNNILTSDSIIKLAIQSRCHSLPSERV